MNPPHPAPASLRRDPAGGPAQRRTRVLHVVTHLDNGGAQANTLLSVAGLDRGRYQVDLAAGPGVLESDALVSADRLVVLPYFRRSLYSLGDLRAAVALLRLVGDYDVVHTHGSKAGVLGRLAARMRRVPAVVHTVHGFPVHDYMPRPRRRLLLALERVAARCADRIVCVCDANVAEALSLSVARPEQVRVVVSGVPSEQVRSGSGDRVRHELGIPAGAPVVGTITRLMEQKAPLDFVEAARRVIEADPEVHVVVVGDGPLRDQVAAAAEGISRLHLLGFRADVPDVLAMLDVVAFSSLWEGLGRALTEAVLAGKPVVATAVNGVPDLVVDGETGYLTSAGRPDELADRILDVLARPDRGAGMGAAGADRVVGSYEVNQMVAGLDQLYQEVLRERRRP
jgi:glycosyltransferase involved in cell wall biosynthesis